MKENISLKELTTFKIGGKARYFIEAKNKNEVTEALKWAKEKKVPFFVLGGGSNLLISDKGFKGLVIKLNFSKVEMKGEIVKAESGVFLSELGRICKEKGLSGLEWSSGIPKATLGGALCMNAGAFGANMADITEQVKALDADDLKIKEFPFKECEFGYKESIFKKNKNLIILSCVLKLEKKAKKEIEKEIERVLNYRKEHHPDFPSAGSVFKNPFKISAGEAIEKAGLKGKRIGGAQISPLHCNFIVNLGGATYSDVKSLIDLAKKEVKKKLNITLEEEVQLIHN